MVYSRDRVVESQVADSELLVAERRADVPSVENKVAEESSGTVLHEYTLVLIASSGGHLEDNIDQGRGLRHLPMDARGTTVDLTEIDDEVTDGAEATLVDIRSPSGE